MARRTLTCCLLPLLLSVGTALVPTVWAADRQAPALRGKSPSAQHTPDMTARSVRQHGLLALLRGISASIERPSVAVTVTEPASSPITLGLRN
jgi:hypothetical protein